MLAVSTSRYFLGIRAMAMTQGLRPIAWTQNDQCQLVYEVITDVMLYPITMPKGEARSRNVSQ